MMRFILLLLALSTLSATNALAQSSLPINPQNFNINADQLGALQKMASKMTIAFNEMQGCLSLQLGDGAMQQVERKGQELTKELKRHCEAGNPGLAKTSALHYADSREGKALIHCSANLRLAARDPQIQAMLGQYGPIVSADQVEDLSEQNICQTVMYNQSAPVAPVQ